VNGARSSLASIHAITEQQTTRRTSESEKVRRPTELAAAPPVETPTKRPSVALVVAVVLTAVLEVLDITIVSVATPHMLGSFGATPDQINWVLTSYLVSAAVVMPLTGHLSERLGRRRLLVISITGFVASSALCGLSWTLASMVLFRLAQGICGAPLVPLSRRSCSTPSHAISGAKRLRSLGWASWSHLCSDRPSAAGSPTPLPGARCSTSTCPSGSLRFCLQRGTCLTSR
jgi:hypothetical protein